MAITAADISRECIPSDDGKRYAKYPAGDAIADPGTPVGETQFTSLYYYEDFTGGTNGANISTVSSFGSSPSVIDDAPLLSNTKCAKDVMTAGVANWPAGGIVNISPKLPRYAELWQRVKVYAPTGFNFDATGGGLKFLRNKIETAAGVHRNYNDLYVDAFDWHLKTIYEGFEVPPANPWTDFSAAYGAVTGQWQTWEFHTVFDTVSVDNGGQGRYDLWRDGVHVGAVTSSRTLSATDLVCAAAYFQTYWNGGVPQNQTWYWTKFALAVKIPGGRDDTVYMATDAAGRKFIGTGD